MNKHREDDKTRRKMLDDALVHIQVIPATAPEPWEFENLIYHQLSYFMNMSLTGRESLSSMATQTGSDVSHT